MGAVYDQARQRAKDRGEKITHVIEKKLADYVTGDPLREAHDGRPDAADNDIKIGAAEVMHGAGTVLLTLDGRYRGCAQLTPDDADRLAVLLVRQAAHARTAGARPATEEAA